MLSRGNWKTSGSPNQVYICPKIGDMLKLRAQKPHFNSEPTTRYLLFFKNVICVIHNKSNTPAAIYIKASGIVASNRSTKAFSSVVFLYLLFIVIMNTLNFIHGCGLSHNIASTFSIMSKRKLELNTKS